MDLIEDRLYHEITNLSDIIAEYDAFLFDIWGVLHEGGELYPGIVELVNKIASKKIVRIISNAPRLRTTTAKNLIDKGLHINYEDMFTSGETARHMLRESNKYFGIDNPVIYHVGQDRNLEIMSDLEHMKTQNIEEADIVLLTAFRDRDEDHTPIIELLEKAASFNKLVLCANPDLDVLHLGDVRFCAGYFAAHYVKLGGKVIQTGKPEKIIYEQCFESFESAGKKMLMIGDTFHTDIEGAHHVAIDSGLVLTGNMGRLITKSGITEKLEATNNICAKQHYQPTFILNMA